MADSEPKSDDGQQPPAVASPVKTREKEAEDYADSALSDDLDGLKDEILSDKKEKARQKQDMDWSKPPVEIEKPKGKSKFIKLMLLLAVLILLSAGAVFGYQMFGHLFFNDPNRYECWDGTMIDNPDRCPPPPVTTVYQTTSTVPIVAPTTIEATTTTTTTILLTEIECYSNEDCVKPTPYVPFCDGNYVKASDIRYNCVHPGTTHSYCQSLVVSPRLVKTCERNEYCWEGECYPEHCRNKKRDWKLWEEKVDCGGPCRPCDDSDTICTVNSDCGEDFCGNPYCNSANNPTHNCTRHFCMNPGHPNATCKTQQLVEVIEVCSRGQTCLEGKDICVMAGTVASCFDCIQNQGEQGVDCGGPCQPCAEIPENHDTLKLNATGTFEYKNYRLRLDRLELGSVRGCSTGAYIRVTDPYAKTQTVKVSRHRNAEYFDITIGMLDSDTSTITIWVVMASPFD